LEVRAKLKFRRDADKKLDDLDIILYFTDGKPLMDFDSIKKEVESRAWFYMHNYNLSHQVEQYLSGFELYIKQGNKKRPLLSYDYSTQNLTKYDFE
jgi:hypothetical protein